MLTHRRATDALPMTVLLFAEGGNEAYGRHVWTLETELPEVGADVIRFAAGYYSIDIQTAADLLNPARIVDSAGAWDDVDFVAALCDSPEVALRAGYRTVDGAVVLDHSAVDLHYEVR